MIEEIRRQAPGCQVEVLMPDFQGREDAIRHGGGRAPPEILNHNIESVPRLYRVVRPARVTSARCDLLEYAKRAEIRQLVTKIGHDGRAGRGDARAAGVFRDLAQWEWTS